MAAKWKELARLRGTDEGLVRRVRDEKMGSIVDKPFSNFYVKDDVSKLLNPVQDFAHMKGGFGGNKWRMCYYRTNGVQQR